MNAPLNCIVAPDASIVDAIRLIDNSSLQIALVTDCDGRLLGTVTDGDVRRAILRGVALSAPVREIMKTTPCLAQAGTSDAELLRRMRELVIHQIPLVDDAGRVVDIKTLDSLLQGRRRANPVVLMAGGIGSRLYPLTATTPKPMLAVGGRPLLETIIERFIAQGFFRFYLSINYHGQIIQDYFGDGVKWGVEIAYLRETERMGTAGSLTLLSEPGNAPLVVMNGDILTSINVPQMLQFHEDHGAWATMALYEHVVQIPYGVVETAEHRVIAITEKPEYRAFINAGIYVLSPAVLKRIPRQGAFDMPELFKNLIEDGKTTAAFPIRESWLDIGTPNDLQRAREQFDSPFPYAFDLR